MVDDFQVERQRAEEENRKKDEKNKRVVEKVEKEFKEQREEISRCVNEARHALELLVPRFDIDESTDNENHLECEKKVSFFFYSNFL